MDRVNQWLTLIANVGVLVGIVFLAMEINQNSTITRVSSVQSIRQSMQAVNYLSMENADFANLHLKLAEDRELGPVELQQARDFAVYMYGQSQMAFYQYRNGLIGEGDLREMTRPFVQWIIWSEHIRDVWEMVESMASSSDGGIETDFVHAINQYLEVQEPALGRP